MLFQKVNDPDVEDERLERIERLNKLVARLHDPTAFQHPREGEKEVGWAEHLKAVEAEELIKAGKGKESLNSHQVPDPTPIGAPVGTLQTVGGLAEHLKTVEAEEPTEPAIGNEPLNSHQTPDSTSIDLPVGPFQTIVGWLRS